MARKKKTVEDSDAEIESATLNEFDNMGPGEIPEAVIEQAEKESE